MNEVQQYGMIHKEPGTLSYVPVNILQRCENVNS